jgi:hypothetical protein
LAEFKGSEAQSDRNVGLVVDEVELGQLFIQKHFRFPPPVSIPATVYIQLARHSGSIVLHRPLYQLIQPLHSNN